MVVTEFVIFNRLFIALDIIAQPLLLKCWIRHLISDYFGLSDIGKYRLLFLRQNRYNLSNPLFLSYTTHCFFFKQVDY